MSDVKLAPFTGIDNVTGEPNAVPGALRDAVNVDVDRFGVLSRRPGLTLVQAGNSASLFSSVVLRRLLFVSSGVLTSLDPTSGALANVGAVNDDELEFAEVNDEVVVGGPNTLAVIRGGALQGLGVEHPAPPIVQATDTGGFQAGRYGVLLTFVAANGEESAASDAIFLTVPANGGIDVIALPAPIEAKVTRVRIYRTTADGDTFYRAAETSLNPGLFALPNAAPGRICDTRHMTRMRPGKYLRYWRGRVLVSRGRALYFSEPMRYGLTDVRHGYIQLPRTITFIEPVEGGIFVGQPDGVLFLRGDSPQDLRVVITGVQPPVPGSSTTVGGSELSDDLSKSSVLYAVWLGGHGFVLGSPDGSVVEPQAKRLVVPVGQRGTTIVHKRRLTTLVH